MSVSDILDHLCAPETLFFTESSDSSGQRTGHPPSAGADGAIRPPVPGKCGWPPTPVGMKIPDDAVIPVEKLTNYLLVARPWGDKSRFLAQAAFDQSNQPGRAHGRDPSPGNRGRGERGWKQRVWYLL